MLKRLYIFFALMLTLLVLAGLSVPMVGAIGEVTATPVPGNAPVTTATPLPLPTTAAPTLVPTLAAPTQSGQPQATPSGDVQALLEAALDQVTDGDFAGAVSTLDQAIQLDPNSDQAYLLRGASYTQLNNYEQALADYTKAIEILPYGWTYYVFRADAYIQLGDEARALLDYEKAMEVNPRYTEAFMGRSQLLTSMGSQSEAAVDDLIAKGLGRAEVGDFTSAISFYNQALSADTTKSRASAFAYYNRALGWYQSEDIQAAIDDYTAALEIYPTMHDSYLGRGIAYAGLEDTRKAGSDFLRRIEILEQETFTQTLSIGDTLDVEMAYGNVYRISFEGLGGDSILIEARDKERLGVDPLIVVLDASGVAIAGDDDFGGGLDALIESVRLPADGTYTLVVSHANGGFEGIVRVGLRRAVNA